MGDEISERDRNRIIGKANNGVGADMSPNQFRSPQQAYPMRRQAVGLPKPVEIFDRASNELL